MGLDMLICEIALIKMLCWLVDDLVYVFITRPAGYYFNVTNLTAEPGISLKRLLVITVSPC